jgi:tRNA A-37 threonylcarbamoyl transferase component Bud32
MSNASSLLQTLPPETHDSAEKVLQEMGTTTADPDPRDVVAELHRRGLLDEGQLRDAVLGMEATRRISSVATSVDAAKGHDILGPLGAGAMGEVLLAKDDLGRVVAVKRLLPHMMGKRAIARRFLKEAQVTAQLDHPSIVPIHSLVRADDGSLGYAMKLVRGSTLEDYFEEAAEQWSKGGIDEQHALNARLERFLSVCDAIAYANDRGVVHRDLKPENIMVGAFGEVIVMDWGIAKLVATPEEKVTDEEVRAPKKAKATRIGMVMGTPRYMSPEQAIGQNDTLDARSDQYALGVILHELVCLQPAVKGDLEVEECLEWAKAARRQPYAVLHRKQPLPAPLCAIVDKACQKDPDARYPSVAAFAEDIRRYLRDEPILARPDTLGDKLGRWVGRNRGKVLVLMVAVALLGVAGVAGTGLFGLTALGAAQYRAQQSEELLARILRDTNVQAMELDAAFRDWNGQLNGLAYAAEAALSDATVARVNPLTAAEPPKLKRSTRYGRAVDLNWPSLASVRGARDRTDYTTLLALGPQFRSTLADSAGLTGSGRPGAQRNAIEAGVPIVWAHVYTEDGYEAIYPGTSLSVGIVEDFRNEWWFTNRKNDRSIVWHPPHVDPKGLGLLASASRTLSDERGNFLGMVRLDVSLQYVLRELLAPPSWATRTYLVDANGNVVMDSDDVPRTTKEYTSRPLPVAAIADVVKQEPSGTRAIRHEGKAYQATWARLAASGWTFVSLAPSGAGPAE